MATMDITSSQMRLIASEIKKQMETWDAAVEKIYSLNAELDATWEGEGKAEFNRMLAEDKTKYQNLSAMMQEYQNAILHIASKYDEGDLEAKSILSAR